MLIKDLKKGTLSLNTVIEEAEKIFGKGSFIEVNSKRNIAIFFSFTEKRQYNIPYTDYEKSQYANSIGY